MTSLLSLSALHMLGAGCVLPVASIQTTLTVSLIVMPIPTIIAVLIVYKLYLVRRAASWRQAQATITKSELKAEHRTVDDVTAVSNVPRVEYQFHVQSQLYRGKRISIGETPGNTVEAENAMKRYPVGANVVVYFNPVNPNECVLERDPPASAGCLLSGAGILLALGIAIVIAILHGESIVQWLQTLFPKSRQPIGVLFFGGAGIMMLMLLWAGRRQAAGVARWPVTQGRIVSSKVESYRKLEGSAGSGRRTTFYEAVIEYAYQVDGREYRGTRLGLGAKVASGSALAQAVVAKYPAETPVTVHYDPQNPSNAALETKVRFARVGLLLALAFLAAAFFFAGMFG